MNTAEEQAKQDDADSRIKDAYQQLALRPVTICLIQDEGIWIQESQDEEGAVYTFPSLSWNKLETPNLMPEAQSFILNLSPGFKSIEFVNDQAKPLVKTTMGKQYVLLAKVTDGPDASIKLKDNVRWYEFAEAEKFLQTTNEHHITEHFDYELLPLIKKYL